MDHANNNKKIEAVINSFNGAERATPAPYLLTRINARLAKEKKYNFWSRISAVISKPLVAGSGIAVFIAVNFWIVATLTNTTSKTVTTQLPTGAKYEFAINVSSIYDIENQEP